MDCVRALQIVSDAMDGIEVDPVELVEAKEHCRNCDECRSFVRAMIAVAQTPLPEPAADLPDRIMATVRNEAKSNALSRARALATPRATVDNSQPATVTPIATFPAAEKTPTVRQRLSDPRNRRAIAAWVGTAAAVFLLAGWGAVAGMRSILSPTAPTEYEFVGQTEYGATADRSGETAESNSAALSAPATGSDVAKQATGPQYVSVDSAVFRLTGPAPELDRQLLSPASTTRTRLDEQSRGKERQVYSASTGMHYVENDDGVLLTLEPVTFVYAGVTYRLQSRPIASVGEWPSLPDSMRQPLAADGSPTFELESAEQSVYRLRDGAAQEGIALSPNPQQAGDLAACPNWTWWEPGR